MDLGNWLKIRQVKQPLSLLLSRCLDHHIDILHSCLGLAALSIIENPDLRPVDPVLCISIRAKEAFEARFQQANDTPTNRHLPPIVDEDELDYDKPIPPRFKPRAMDDGLQKGDITKAIVHQDFFQGPDMS